MLHTHNTKLEDTKMKGTHLNPGHADIRLSHNYVVKRSNGDVEGGWKLRDAQYASRYNIITSPRQNKVMVVYKYFKGGELTKAVPYDDFIRLNPTF